MNALAAFIGWAVMVSGGLALTAFLVGVTLNYGWRKYRDAISYAELCDAVRAWRGRAAAEIGKEAS